MAMIVDLSILDSVNVVLDENEIRSWSKSSFHLADSHQHKILLRTRRVLSTLNVKRKANKMQFPK